MAAKTDRSCEREVRTRFRLDEPPQRLDELPHIRVFSISANFRYNGPRYYAQGKQEARFGSGLKGQVNMFQRKLNVAFSVENIFGSSVRNFYELTKDYEQYSNNRRNVRYLSLNLTYNIRKFNKLGKKGPKEFELGTEEEESGPPRRR